MKGAAKDLSRHGAGCVAARKNRQSGALRQLYRPGSQSDDPGWLIICADHGSCLAVTTRRMGEDWMAEPSWCDDCVAEVQRRCGEGGGHYRDNQNRCHNCGMRLD